MLLLASLAIAQQDDQSAAEAQYGNPNAGTGGACANPREVVSIGPETDNSGTEFRTTADTFRVSYDVTFTEPGASRLVDIEVEDRFGLVESETVERSVSGAFLVPEGPGAFELVVDVEPENAATYTIVIEDCIEADGGNADDNTNGDTGSSDVPDDSVVAGTTPDKPLPNTGGPPLLAPAALGLASAAVGASVLRAGLRREG